MNLNREDKLALIRFNLDPGKPHISLNKEICRSCQVKPCLYICPIENYRFEDKEIHFSCEACLECGACGLVCPSGAIEWSYPKGGFGVCYRFG